MRTMSADARQTGNAEARNGLGATDNNQQQLPGITGRLPDNITISEISSFARWDRRSRLGLGSDKDGHVVRSCIEGLLLANGIS